MIRVVFKYYCDVNFFNLIYSILLGALFLNFFYIPIIFASIGTFLGISSFKYFYKNEYYFYYNLGFTKKKLNVTVLSLNVFVSVIILLIYNVLR